MKMAIVGSGPLAILTAAHFDQIGAEVVLFQRSPLGGNVRFLMEEFPDLKIQYKNDSVTITEFFENVIVPTVVELEKFELTKKGDVLRVHKRFLHKEETVPGRTRMFDLFRVIYSQNPQDAILKQLEENPDFFKQLGEDVINSLHKPVESFEDFDIVIEARGMGRTPMPIGAGGSLALNENNLRESTLLYYEKDIFTKLDLENKKSIVITGEGATLKLALLKFKDWLLKTPGHEIHWVTYKPVNVPCGNAWLDSEVAKLLTEVEVKFDKAKLEFEKKMREWRDLEDYIKVKIPKPVEPTPLLIIHQGYDVTSVDRLLDREGVFATIEAPVFREFNTNETDMMTLAADALCIARGVSTETLGSGLTSDEPGFYTLQSTDIDSALSEIKQIEEKILNYFKKA
ncbi:MAG: hypothetical protein H7177_03795 [Rhizobacter sp.]|nr:hypothetical protein [Bacteriovorax sp.]